MSDSSSEAAICCANFYEQDWVQGLLGESFHPGGQALSTRLIQSLGLPSDARVLDAACGIGTTTRIMSGDFGLRATGIDLSRSNVNKATELAKGLPAAAKPIDFVCGPVDSLPFADDAFDAVVCECAVSTFGQQADVLAEFRRVLKPGGVLGISDMAVEGHLPTEIQSQIAPWTCLAEAHSVLGYQQLFLDAGFTVLSYADESPSLKELVGDLKRKLLAAGLGKALGATMGAADGVELSISDIRGLLATAKELIDNGTVQYCRMLLSKGRPTHTTDQAAEITSGTTPNSRASDASKVSSDCGCVDGNC